MSALFLNPLFSFLLFAFLFEIPPFPVQSTGPRSPFADSLHRFCSQFLDCIQHAIQYAFKRISNFLLIFKGTVLSPGITLPPGDESFFHCIAQLSEDVKKKNNVGEYWIALKSWLQTNCLLQTRETRSPLNFHYTESPSARQDFMTMMKSYYPHHRGKPFSRVE